MSNLNRLRAGKLLLAASVVILVVSILSFVGLYLADDAGAVGDVRVTNVTANSATISWTTERPAAGKVYYSLNDTWTPFLDRMGKALAVDDRDVQQNHQGRYVLTDQGIMERVTHHVTLRNLSPNTTYYYRVGENLRLFAGPDASFTTGDVAETVAVPDPVYGGVYKEGDLTQPTDGIIYYRLYAVEGTEEISTLEYSSVLSEQGTWSGDLSDVDTTIQGTNIKNSADASLWVEAKTELGSTRYSFPLEDYKPLPNIYVQESFDSDGSSDADEDDTAQVQDSLLGDVLSAVSSPVSAESACSEDYYEACPEGGQKLCHKRGVSPDGSGGAACSWGAGSYCEACTGGGGTTPSQPAPAPSTGSNNCLASGCSRGEGQVWLGGSSGLCRICQNGCTQAAPDTTACCSLLSESDTTRRAKNGCPVAQPAPQPTTPPQEPNPGSASVPNGGSCTARDGVIECQSGICCGCQGQANEPGMCFASQAACDQHCAGGSNAESPGITLDECPAGSRETPRGVTCYSADIFCPGSTLVNDLSDTSRSCVYRKGDNLYKYEVGRTSTHACFPTQAIVEASDRCKADIVQPDVTPEATPEPVQRDCPIGTTSSVGPRSCLNAGTFCDGSSLTVHRFGNGGSRCTYSVSGVGSYTYSVQPQENHDSRACYSNNLLQAQADCLAAVESQENPDDTGTTIEAPVQPSFNAVEQCARAEYNYHCPDVECQGGILQKSIAVDNGKIGCIIYGPSSVTASAELIFNGSCEEATLNESSGFVNGAIPLPRLRSEFCSDSTSLQNTYVARNVLGAEAAAQPVDPGVYKITGQGVEDSEIVIESENVSIIFFIDSNGDGIRQDTELVADSSFNISLEKTEDTAVFDLNEGWSLIGLPILSPEYSTASKLMSVIKEQGVDATHIATFSDDGWQIFSERNNSDSGSDSTMYGTDFTLIPGAGLFIKSESRATFSLTGNKISSSVPLNLSRGWNLVSVQAQTEYTAGTLIEACEAANMSCDTVSRYESGRYDNVIKDAGTLFGLDFNIISTRGYFLRVKDGQGGQFAP